MTAAKSKLLNRNDKKMVSVSRLNMYLMCGRKYWFKYINNLSEEKKYYLTRGGIFHEVLAELLLDRKKSKQYYIDRVYDYVDEAKQRNEPLSDYKTSESRVIGSIINAVDNYYDRLNSLKEFKVIDYDNGIDPAKKSIELEFAIPFVDIETMEVLNKEYFLYGFIDMISHDDENGLSIRDHKLHSKKYTQFELETDIQLGMYAYAFTYMFNMGFFPDLKDTKLPKKIRVGFNSSLLKGSNSEFNFINYDLNLKNIKHKVDIALDTIKLINGGIFVPSYGDHCGWKCGFQDPCNRMSTGKDISASLTKLDEKKSKASVDLIKELEKEELF